MLLLLAKAVVTKMDQSVKDPEAANGMANSVDPDISAPEGQAWVCMVCSVISILIFRYFYGNWKMSQFTKLLLYLL